MPFNDNRIEHFIVLMLENRSFDHMLGFSGIPGIDGLTGAETNPDTTGAPVKVSNNAQYIGDYEPDPGHELFDVNVQTWRRTMRSAIAGFRQCRDPPCPTALSRMRPRRWAPLWGRLSSAICTPSIQC